MKEQGGLKAVLQVSISMELAQLLNETARTRGITVPSLVRDILFTTLQAGERQQAEKGPTL